MVSQMVFNCCSTWHCRLCGLRLSIDGGTLITGADMVDAIGSTSPWYTGAKDVEPPVLVGDENYKHNNKTHHTTPQLLLDINVDAISCSGPQKWMSFLSGLSDKEMTMSSQW